MIAEVTRMNEEIPKRIRPSGGYRALRSFQTATLIYDATVSFCEGFIDKRSRLVDQMVQAARSGRQNIAEGSRASATSSQTELRLVNVARASLDELLLDYEDFLRQHGQRQWAKDDAEAMAVRGVGKTLGGQAVRDRSDRTDRTDGTDGTDETVEHRAAYAAWLDHADPAVRANAVICLIHQANYLLDQQIAGLERSFINEGGYSESLAAARLQARQRPGPATLAGRPGRAALAGSSARELPPCPLCAGPMVLRTARQGKNAGSQFLGCAAYPTCRGTAKL
jgi:four helix bundle suffix protein